MTTRIIGTGSCLPKAVVTNDDLAKIMDTSDEWISSRTGIRQRRLVTEETTVSMSAEAAKRALENAGMQAEEIELIIVGTITADHVTPSAACELQAAIGAKNAVAFDINAACSGFLFALITANAYFTSGIYKNALILGAETMSRIVDWEDRGTCVLFGDGAGAAVVRAEDTGLLAFEQCSDGAKGHVLSCKNRSRRNPLTMKVLAEGGEAEGADGNAAAKLPGTEAAAESTAPTGETTADPYSPDYIHMNGQEVYKFAVSTVPASIQRVLEKGGVSAEEISYFVLHQANLRILQAVAKRLHVPEEKCPVSLDHCGNISAASVPILLDEMNRKGMLKAGDRIILSGFGAGLTWGTVLLEW